MDWLSSREKKIFLTVLLVLGLFVQWYGVNANSRMDLTRSIADTGDFNINESYQNTGDRSLVGETYYSDKAPGLSFLATPVYASWKIIYSIAGDTAIDERPRKTLFEVNENTLITAPESPGGFYLSALILVTFLTSTLSVAVLSILVYRLSGEKLEDERLRLVLTFGFAFGSLVTHYGTMFLPNAAATLFSFSSFYLLYQWDDYPGRQKMVFAGFLGGFAVIISTLTGIVLVANAVYAFLKYRKLPVYYTLGGFIGGLPYMIYNTVNFGAPWNLPRNYLDPVIWANLQDNVGFRIGLLHNLFVSLRLTFMPYRGIFFWFPMLLFSLAGYLKFYADKKLEALVVGGIVASGVLLVSSWWAWWHGGWFGARHLVFLMPFLMIPIFYGVENFDRRLVYLLVAVSVAVNLAGFQGGYEDSLKDLSDSSQMVEEAKVKMQSLQPLGNPLKDYYIQGLMQNGFHSRLVDSLVNGDIPPDIRSYSDTPTASTIIVGWLIAGVVGLIWRKDIQAVLSAHRDKILETVEHR